MCSRGGFSMELSQPAHRTDLLQRWITAGHQRRLLSAWLLRVESMECKGCLSDWQKGVVVKLDVAPQTVWDQSWLLNAMFRRWTVALVARSLCHGQRQPCTSVPALTGVWALEGGQGPSRKQTNLDSSHSIPTSLHHTTLKAPSPLPGLHSEQHLTQDSSETQEHCVLGTLPPTHTQGQTRDLHTGVQLRELCLCLNQQQTAVKDMKEQACGEILLSKWITYSKGV